MITRVLNVIHWVFTLAFIALFSWVVSWSWDAAQLSTKLAPSSPQVSTLETKAIQPKQVVVLEPKAKAVLKLPKAVQADTTQHVVASSKVDSSLVPKTITTVLDEDTGLFTTYEQDLPRPWLAVRDTGSATVSYGFKGGEQVARMSINQSLFQIKALEFGAVAHLDSDGEHFVGLGATYRW